MCNRYPGEIVHIEIQASQSAEIKSWDKKRRNGAGIKWQAYESIKAGSG